MIKHKILLKCKRCGHSWKSCKKKLPKRCPLCKNPNWNKENIADIINLIVE